MQRVGGISGYISMCLLQTLPTLMMIVPNSINILIISRGFHLNTVSSTSFYHSSLKQLITQVSRGGWNTDVTILKSTDKNGPSRNSYGLSVKSPLIKSERHCL